MKIISKTHDFYDGVMATDHDRDFCYERIRQEIELSSKELDMNNSSNRFPNFDSAITFYLPKFKPFDVIKVHFKILGFCGELIPIMCNPNTAGETDIKIGRAAIFETVERDFKKYKVWFGNAFGEIFDERIGKMLVNKKLQNVFYEYKVPIFIYSENNMSRRGDTRLILNPTLRDFNFQKYLDPYQTYQRIRQFIENDIAVINMKKPPKLSDIDMLESKGFDKRISFRKEKTDASKRR